MTVNSMMAYGDLDGDAKDKLDQYEREALAEYFNWLISILYPSMFALFNIIMFSIIPS